MPKLSDLNDDEKTSILESCFSELQNIFQHNFDLYQKQKTEKNPSELKNYQVQCCHEIFIVIRKQWVEIELPSLKELLSDRVGLPYFKDYILLIFNIISTFAIVQKYFMQLCYFAREVLAPAFVVHYQPDNEAFYKEFYEQLFNKVTHSQYKVPLILFLSYLKRNDFHESKTTLQACQEFFLLWVEWLILQNQQTTEDTVLTLSHPIIHDMKLVLIAPDGSCLYSAVSEGLVISELRYNAFTLRNILSGFLNQLPESHILWQTYLNETMLSNMGSSITNPREYIKSISKTNMWGGELEISVMANYLFNCPFIVFERHAQMKIYNFEEFQSRLQGKANNNICSVFLVYDGAHYDALIIQKSDEFRYLLAIYRTQQRGEFIRYEIVRDKDSIKLNNTFKPLFGSRLEQASAPRILDRLIPSQKDSTDNDSRSRVLSSNPTLKEQYDFISEGIKQKIKLVLKSKDKHKFFVDVIIQAIMQGLVIEDLESTPILEKKFASFILYFEKSGKTDITETEKIIINNISNIFATFGRKGYFYSLFKTHPEDAYSKLAYIMTNLEQHYNPFIDYLKRKKGAKFPAKRSIFSYYPLLSHLSISFYVLKQYQDNGDNYNLIAKLLRMETFNKISISQLNFTECFYLRIVLIDIDNSDIDCHELYSQEREEQFCVQMLKCFNQKRYCLDIDIILSDSDIQSINDDNNQAEEDSTSTDDIWESFYLTLEELNIDGSDFLPLITEIKKQTSFHQDSQYATTDNTDYSSDEDDEETLRKSKKMRA